MMSDALRSEDARPNGDDTILAALSMSMVSGVGPRLYTALKEEFGSPENILCQSVASLCQVAGIGRKTAEAIHGVDKSAARDVLNRCRELDISLLQRGQPGYPSQLANVEDAPELLYARGSIRAQDDLAVSIVGSRRCTTYGRQQAERLAGALVRAGITVVSGLARGIDAAAHRGALAAGGRTIAVMATGVREIYPPEHADLALEVIEHGAVISEFPLDQKPRPGLFPQRNRIISGLSMGVIVVEAARNSGALYTARHALEQGREVFAVPGQVDSPASAGCHDLIRDGVTLIRTVDDVLAELGPLAQPAQTPDSPAVHNPRELTLNPQEKEVLDLIGTSPVHVDDILRTTQLEMSRVLSTITVLEMKRFVRRMPGNMLVRNV